MTPLDNDKVRIAPVEIGIPSEDPFQFDGLDRKSSVETLSSIVDAAITPCVIAIDGEWGSGKTTFLKMCREYMRAQGFHVAWFNAWETDFATNPFQALSAELTDSLAESGYAIGVGMAETLKKVAAPVVVGLVKTGMGMVLPGAATVIDAGVQAIDAWRDGDPISEYLELKKSIKTFQETLAEISTRVSKQTHGKPLVIAIDELDRCRPSYAIELLEMAKHIFMTDNVVFVLAINSSELAHSVKSLYGTEFDAETYLRRFINLSIKMPHNNHRQFATSKIDATGWRESISDKPHEFFIPHELMIRFIGKKTEFSIRDAEQTTYHLDLIMRLSSDMQPLWATTVIIGLILKATIPALYLKVLEGELPCQEIVEAVFNNVQITSMDIEEQRDLAYIKPRIESVIIAACTPRLSDASDRMFWGDRERDNFNSNSALVLEHIQRLEDHSSNSVQIPYEEQEYSRVVINSAFNMWVGLTTGDTRPALVRAVEIIELLSY